MTRDYYDTLGVPKNATPEQIKSAYKEAAKKFHPDVNKETGAEDKFKEVLEAYTVLSDPAKRQNYDQYGNADTFSQATGFDFGSFFRNAGFDRDFSDIFANFGPGGFEDERTFRAQHEPVDLRMDVEIPLEEAFSGVEKTVTIEVDRACANCKGRGFEKESDVVTCSTCKGRGIVDKVQRLPFGSFSMRTTCPTCRGEGKRIENPCKSCKGRGKTTENKKLSVKIPAGIESGNHLRLRGQGSFSNGRQGDLYLVIIVKPHKIFKRDGADLFMKLPISFVEAALGANIEIEQLNHAKEMVEIPEGTQTDSVFKLRGRGMPVLGSKARGDLYLEVKVKTPTKLNKEQREALQKLDEKHNSPKSFLDRIKESFK